MLLAGVNLFALALIVKLLIGWPLWLSIVLSAVFVLAYITLGGLAGAIYGEVLQFFVILAGLIPIVVIGLHTVSRRPFASLRWGPPRVMPRRPPSGGSRPSGTPRRRDPRRTEGARWPVPRTVPPGCRRRAAGGDTG